MNISQDTIKKKVAEFDARIVDLKQKHGEISEALNRMQGQAQQIGQAVMMVAAQRDILNSLIVEEQDSPTVKAVGHPITPNPAPVVPGQEQTLEVELPVPPPNPNGGATSVDQFKKMMDDPLESFGEKSIDEAAQSNPDSALRHSKLVVEGVSNEKPEQGAEN